MECLATFSVSWAEGFLLRTWSRGRPPVPPVPTVPQSPRSPSVLAPRCRRCRPCICAPHTVADKRGRTQPLPALTLTGEFRVGSVKRPGRAREGGGQRGPWPRLRDTGHGCHPRSGPVLTPEMQPRRGWRGRAAVSARKDAFQDALPWMRLASWAASWVLTRLGRPARGSDNEASPSDARELRLNPGGGCATGTIRCDFLALKNADNRDRALCGPWTWAPRGPPRGEEVAPLPV